MWRGTWRKSDHAGVPSSRSVSCGRRAKSGRVVDTIFVERLWRRVKDEQLYLYDHETVAAVAAGLAEYFPFSNTERPH
jgi:Integrase core domain